MRPNHAQNDRPIASDNGPLPGLSMNLMSTKINVSTARTAVIIDGVTPISTLMFARRTACQTMSAMTSRPAMNADAVPHVHAIRPIREPMEERNDE